MGSTAARLSFAALVRMFRASQITIICRIACVRPTGVALDFHCRTGSNKGIGKKSDRRMLVFYGQFELVFLPPQHCQFIMNRHRDDGQKKLHPKDEH
ncbi:MAG: hypothetical protein WDM80_06390 [Limisphaerales bacterium]